MKRGPPKRAPCRVAVCLVLVDVDLAAPCASITAFTDTNNNGVNNGEPSDTATRTRVVPSSSPGLRNRDHRRRLDRRANGDQARGGVRGLSDVEVVHILTHAGRIVVRSVICEVKNRKASGPPPVMSREAVVRRSRSPGPLRWSRSRPCTDG